MNIQLKNLILLIFIAGLTLFSPATAQITVDPIGFAISAESDDSVTVAVTLTNIGDADVNFNIGFDEPPEEEARRGGPRRDEVDLSGLMFAVFQDQQAYNWLSEQMVGPVVDDEQMDSYRNGGDWDDVEFTDYDVIVIAAGARQSYSQQYSNNYDRFCEYIDGGGTAYMETHDPNSPIHSPGDIVNDVNHRTESGTLIVSPDPDDENYSLFAEICHESQENNWEEGEQIEGNAWLHSAYSEDQFSDGVDDGTLEWYQVLANASNNQPGCIAYGYGRGTVMVLGHPTGHCWTNWVQDGQWGSIAAEILFYLVEITGPKWILPDPEEGIISANDATEVTFIIQPIEMEDGVYEMRVLFELAEAMEERDDLEQTMIEISAVMSLNTDSALLNGTITNAADDEVVEGVRVDMDRYMISRFTDEDGLYSFTDLPLGDYQFTFTASDFLPTIENIAIDEAMEYELNVALLHSECNPDRESIEMTLPRESEEHVGFRVTNDGNGPLTYNIDRRLLGDANAEPWDLRNSIDASPAVQDSRLEGVVFDGDYFYVSGSDIWEGDNGPNMVYVVNRDGELVTEYEQCGTSRYGFRDMAYDGELIWASGEEDIFGFDPENGQSVTSFNGPFSSHQALAWDSDREILWVAGTVSNYISGLDVNGREVVQLARNGLRLYGFAYYPEDPDDHPLYIFADTGDNSQRIYKLNPETENGDTMFVQLLEPEGGGSPGGAFITNQYDVYSWVFVDIADAGGDDRIDMWQVDARKDWMVVDPFAGVIPTGEGVDFDLLLSTYDFPEVVLEGELVFVHDGIGGETPIALTLNIEGGPAENEPPSAFDLVYPVDMDTLSPADLIDFSWMVSTDPNEEDTVSYILWFGTEADSIWFALDDTTKEVMLDTVFYNEEMDYWIDWWVQAVSRDFVFECNDRFSFMVDVTGISEENNNLPAEFAIQSVYPNPFNAQTNIRYGVPNAEHVSLRVYDCSGRLVETIFNGVKSAGWHSGNWDAGSNSTGVYFVQLIAPGASSIYKIILAK